MRQKKEMTLAEMVGEIKTAKLQLGVLRWNDDLFTRRMVAKEDVEDYQLLPPEDRFRLRQGAQYAAEHNGSWATPALSVGMPLFFTVALQGLILKGLPAEASLANLASMPIFFIVLVLLFVGLSESRKRACAKTWVEALAETERVLSKNAEGAPKHRLRRRRFWPTSSRGDQ